MSFRVPTHFRMDVQKHLEAKRPLNFEQICVVCRTVVDAIEGHTHCPDCNALNLVIILVLDKHPHLDVDVTSTEGTTESSSTTVSTLISFLILMVSSFGLSYKRSVMVIYDSTAHCATL